MTANYFGRLQVFNIEEIDLGEHPDFYCKGYSDVLFDGQYIYYCPYDQAKDHGVVLRYNTSRPFKDAGAWASYDAGNTDGLRTKSYWGMAFDGRFIYFAPSKCRVAPYAQGKVLRYDTQAPLKAASSWAAYDAETTDGLVCRGFRGAVFDSRYVYFVPYRNDDSWGFHAVFLRYDSQGPFKEASSWSAFDAQNIGGGPNKGYWGGVKDGDYIYFAPYNWYADHGRVLRYNNTRPFKEASSWDVIDLAAINPGCLNLASPAADANFVYFSPGERMFQTYALFIARYNKAKPFTDPAAWDIFDLQNLEPYPQAHAACFFYGKYVIFGAYNNDLLAYDTEKPFTDPAAWTVRDAANSDGEMYSFGYRGVAADDHYFYFSPAENDALIVHGLAMRCRVPLCVNQSPPVPGVENLTTYYLEEPGYGIFDITSDRVRVLGTRLGDDEYLYKCYGFGAFRELEVDFEVRLLAASYEPLPEIRIIKHGALCFSNKRAGQRKSLDTDDLAVQLRVDFLAGVVQHSYIQLDRLNGGEGESYETSQGTTYYCKLLRQAASMSTVQLMIYGDSARANLLAILTQGGFSADRWWRFIYAIRDSGDWTGEMCACDFECGGINIIEH